VPLADSPTLRGQGQSFPRGNGHVQGLSREAPTRGGTTVPIIEVKAFEQRFEDEETARLLIAKLTDALVDICGEALREETWVVLEGVSPRHWGFGGHIRT
jgi:4-oxalocrotonate tautomerase